MELVPREGGEPELLDRASTLLAPQGEVLALLIEGCPSG
jgi:hypothetical protein